jgi:hypothetical protein
VPACRSWPARRAAAWCVGSRALPQRPRIASVASALSYGLVILPGMDDPVAELAVFFRRRAPVPVETLVRLTSAARTAGHNWATIAAVCGVTSREDAHGVIMPAGFADSAAALLFLGTQTAVQKLTGGRRFPPLTWSCPACGKQVTDRAPTGRPAHIEHGHASGCARLSRDQATDAETRRDRLPHLIGESEPACGALQRHRLTRAIISDCPRCGWHGYFHDYLATVDGDWSRAVCDNCYADLHPAITVTVQFFSVRSAGSCELFAVVRQRTRSDHPFPDIGQQLAWRLSWEHTTLLTEDARGAATAHLVAVSRDDVEGIAASLASHYWPPDAAELPWVVNGYPV